jgi:hypothetical protein
MDPDCDITELVRASDRKSMHRAVAAIKEAYGVSDTGAYAIYVRTAAGCPLPSVNVRTQLSTVPPLLAG